jgi:hypothetical protein
MALLEKGSNSVRRVARRLRARFGDRHRRRGTGRFLARGSRPPLRVRLRDGVHCDYWDFIGALVDHRQWRRAQGGGVMVVQRFQCEDHGLRRSCRCGGGCSHRRAGPRGEVRQRTGVRIGPCKGRRRPALSSLWFGAHRTPQRDSRSSSLPPGPRRRRTRLRWFHRLVRRRWDSSPAVVRRLLSGIESPGLWSAASSDGRLSGTRDGP